jgi:chitinase
MGYYPNWDTSLYPVSAIHWAAMTHIATAFYLPDGSGGFSSGSFDPSSASAVIAAAHAHGVKAIASIGGASTGQLFESAMQSAQMAFVASLEGLIAQGYDGLDLDWEGGNLSLAQDQAMQTTLIQALRAASPGIIITLTAGTENQNYPDNLSWYGTVAPMLDRINLMTYGMSGTYPGWQSWHSAPLHWNNVSSTPAGIDGTVALYVAAGVPAAKLGVGAGFYGECYTGPVTAPMQALGSSQVTGCCDAMSYRNIVDQYYSPSAYHYDTGAQAPYLTLDGNNPSGCTYVTYEDPTSIAAKGAWARSQGLGGVILWTISESYIASAGSTPAQQNPLLEAVRAAFLQ